jgi:hypothetical protein
MPWGLTRRWNRVPGSGDSSSQPGSTISKTMVPRSMSPDGISSSWFVSGGRYSYRLSALSVSSGSLAAELDLLVVAVQRPDGDAHDTTVDADRVHVDLHAAVERLELPLGRMLRGGGRGGLTVGVAAVVAVAAAEQHGPPPRR